MGRNVVVRSKRAMGLLALGASAYLLAPMAAQIGHAIGIGMDGSIRVFFALAVLSAAAPASLALLLPERVAPYVFAVVMAGGVALVSDNRTDVQAHPAFYMDLSGTSFVPPGFKHA